MCDNKRFWVALAMALREQIWTMGVPLPEDVGVSSNRLHILPYFPLCKVVYGQRLVDHKYDIMSAHKTKQPFVSEMHFLCLKCPITRHKQRPAEPVHGRKFTFALVLFTCCLSPSSGRLPQLHPTAGVPGRWAHLRVRHLRLRPSVCLPG